VASPADMDKFTSMGLPATIDYLLEYQNVADPDLDTRLSDLTIDPNSLTDLQRWWLVRMIYTKRPLLEKMVLFWHGILTSAISKVGNVQFMRDQNELFRKQPLGDYGALLKAVSRDPAMLIWLDSRANRKQAPNENFGRELMELFTMGVGHYTETDVREAARAFTGWNLRGDSFVFDISQHDGGAKTFLGQTGDFDGDNIIDIIMSQRAAAEFISRKLFEFFAYDNPSPSTVSRLADVFTSSNRSIKAVVRQIFVSDEFYSPQAYRAKIKSPAELVAGVIRALRIETDGSPLIGLVTNMGQALFNPQDVSGWKGGTAWINTNTLLYRINFANQVATARTANFSFNPADLLARQSTNPPDDAIDFYLRVLLDGVMAGDEKGVLAEYYGSPADMTVPPRTGKSAADEKMRSLVFLVLASPDYQMA
jgi:uncharacterized protein (DUF1800 family)